MRTFDEQATDLRDRTELAVTMLHGLPAPTWDAGGAPRLWVRDHFARPAVAYAYRTLALRQPFRDVDVGAVFHGLAEPPDTTLTDLLAVAFPWFRPTLTFLRQSPAGQAEPNYVHTDRDMGGWTAIWYLTRTPAPGDGTLFWRHASGAQVSQAQTAEALLAEGLACRDEASWTPVQRIVARFNRLVLFEAGAYHSRALRDNYGTGDDARLIQVAFGAGSPTGDDACQ